MSAVHSRAWVFILCSDVFQKPKARFGGKHAEFVKRELAEKISECVSGLGCLLDGRAHLPVSYVDTEVCLTGKRHSLV